MDKYLFRGIVSNTFNENHFKGNFVEGSLIYCEDEEESTITNDDFLADVLTETVGQFAGEFDKNKKPIFEGDILMEKNYKKEFLSVVKKIGSGFFSVGINGFIRTNLLKGSNKYVVGNVHQNKDLIK